MSLICAGVVTADWHIDRFNRIDDFARCVDYVIEWAVEKKKKVDGLNPGAVIPFHFQFVGDAYKTWSPAPIEMAVFHKLNCLSDHGIRGSIVTGNHDWPESEDHRGVHCFTEAKTLGFALGVVDQPTVEKVVVHDKYVANYVYIPHIPKAALQRSGKGYGEYFAQTVKALVDKDCDPRLPTILFTHCYLKEAAVGPCDLVVEGDRQISVKDLQDPRVSAVFLGDIHKAQKLGDAPLILYPGSIDRVDFGEINEPKGFVYYEVSVPENHAMSCQVAVQFIPTPAREFRHIVLDMTPGAVQEDKTFEKAPEDPAELQAWAERQIASHQSLKGAIVKLTIRCGPNQKDLVNDRRLSDLLAERGVERVRSVNFDVTTPEQRRAPEITEGLSPVLALDKWVGMQNYSPIVATAIRQAGKKLIGVEG